MRSTNRFAVAASLALPLILVANEARAGVFIHAEFDGAEGVAMPGGTHLGYGLLGALGYRIGLGPVFLQPEVAGSYMTFPSGTVPPSATRLLGGLRFGLGLMVQPTVFGHAGVGWLGSAVDGPSFDVGLALGFKLVPIFSFGAQGAYNVVTVLANGEATRWVSFGVHAAVEF
jgi:hypothetical protein